jgi:murein DD-endopeptidase MepM/ murein hydrolase activator NlpD
MRRVAARAPHERAMVRVTLIAFSLLVLAGCAAEEDAPPPPRVTGADVYLRPDTTAIRGVVPNRTTMGSMLRAHGLDGSAVDEVVAAARAVFDPRRLRSLQPFLLERTLDGALRLFEYEIDNDSFLRITKTPGVTSGVRAEVLPIPKTLETATASGEIGETTPSLFQSIETAGEGVDLAIAMAEVFAGEIDFNTDLQPGDRYTVTFERFRREGRPDSYGAITAARFENDGRVVHAFRFTTPGSKPDYYDENGRSLKRFFLRSPLKFVPQVTSGFSSRRMHPVLHTARAHRGVDYAAPPGAPVVSIAAGRVVSASFDNANGRMVRVRHSSGYESYYLHLSAFAPGIKAGASISQGETIGRVGATGLATGPHLHYGLKKNGLFVNPLQEHRNLPPGDPVPASAMARFTAERDRALAALGPAQTTPVATR